jgi:DNA-nicking Smr family endonuclease
MAQNMNKAAGDRAGWLGDRALWNEAMRDVRPLRGRAALPPILPSAPAEPPRVVDRPAPATDARPLDRFADLDRANAERLKRGGYPIEARLDLHGLTQAEAHRQLIEFIEGCYEAGRRCVLVVTGRGLGPDGPGVLKSAVPRWLAQTGLRHRLLAVATAQPRHGGAGALYVLLRRRR